MLGCEPGGAAEAGQAAAAAAAAAARVRREDGSPQQYYPLYSLRCLLRVSSAKEDADEAEAADDRRRAAKAPSAAASGRAAGAAAPAATPQPAAAMHRDPALGTSATALQNAGKAVKNSLKSAAKAVRASTVGRSSARADSRAAVSIRSVRVCSTETYCVVACLCTNGGIVLRFTGDARGLLGVKDGLRRTTAAPAIAVVTHFAGSADPPVAIALSPSGSMLLAVTAGGGLWLVPSGRLLFPTCVREDSRSPLLADEPAAMPRLADYLKSTDSVPLCAEPTVPEGEQAVLLLDIRRHHRRSTNSGRVRVGVLRDVVWWRSRGGRDAALVVAESGSLIVVCVQSRQEIRCVQLPHSSPTEVHLVVSAQTDWALVVSPDCAHKVILQQAAADPSAQAWADAPKKADRRSAPTRQAPAAGRPPPQCGRTSAPPVLRTTRALSSIAPSVADAAVRPQERHRAASHVVPAANAGRAGSQSSSRQCAPSSVAESVNAFDPQIETRYSPVSGGQVRAVHGGAGRHGVAVFSVLRQELEMWDAAPTPQGQPLYHYNVGPDVVQALLTPACVVCAMRPKTGDSVAARRQQLTIMSRFAAAAPPSRRPSAGVLQVLMLPGETVSGMEMGWAGRGGVDSVVVWTRSCVYELSLRRGCSPDALFLSTLRGGRRGALPRETLRHAEAVASAFRLDIVQLYQVGAQQCVRDRDYTRAVQLLQHTGVLPLVFARSVTLPLPVAELSRVLHQNLRQLLTRGHAADLAEPAAYACLHVLLRSSRSVVRVLATPPDSQSRRLIPEAASPLRHRASAADDEAALAARAVRSLGRPSVPLLLSAPSHWEQVHGAMPSPVGSSARASSGAPAGRSVRVGVAQRSEGTTLAPPKGFGGASVQATAASADVDFLTSTPHGGGPTVGDESTVACDAVEQPPHSDDDVPLADTRWYLAALASCPHAAPAFAASGVHTEDALAVAARCSALSPEEVLAVAGAGGVCPPHVARCLVELRHAHTLCAAAGGALLATLPDTLRLQVVMEAVSGLDAPAPTPQLLGQLKGTILACRDLPALARAARQLCGAADGPNAVGLSTALRCTWTEAAALACCRAACFAAEATADGGGSPRSANSPSESEHALDDAAIRCLRRQHPRWRPEVIVQHAASHGRLSVAAAAASVLPDRAAPALQYSLMHVAQRRQLRDGTKAGHAACAEAAAAVTTAMRRLRASNACEAAPQGPQQSPSPSPRAGVACAVPAVDGGGVAAVDGGEVAAVAARWWRRYGLPPAALEAAVAAD